MDAIALLQSAQSAYSAQQYGRALEIISTAELEGKACPEIILLKGACVQLASETDFPIAHALDVYRALLQSRPDDPRVLTEAAYFLLNVSDDAAASKPYFSRAVQIYAQRLAEALEGLGRACTETSAPMDEESDIVSGCIKSLSETLQRLQGE